MRIIVALLSLLVLAGQAKAAELHRGRCHMDECSWFSIESVDLVGSSGAGALFKVESRWWSSTHPNGSYEKPARRTGGELTTSYALCSKTRPTLIDQSEGKWMASTLGIGRENSIYGATETATMLYFAICHQMSVTDPYEASVKLGRRFGYRVAGETDQVTVARPEDVLSAP